MKKVVLIVLTCAAVMAATGFIAFRVIAAKGTSRSKVSQKYAQSLQAKIDAIKKAAGVPGRKRGSSHVELSEDELESYVLYSLKEDIPAQIDSIDVRLTPDVVSSGTQITFTSNATGNAVVD